MRTLFIAFFILATSAVSAQRVYSLREAVDTALKNNLELKQAGLQMDIAAIDWRQSKANLFPNLNGFANHGINQGRSIDPFSNSYIDQQINFAGYGLSTGVTLFNGFGLLNTIKQNSYAYEASKMDVQQQRDILTLNIILAYLQVMSNEDLLVQAQNQVEVSRQQVERLDKMNKEGAITPSLLSNLQGELAGNELAVVNAQNALELSRLTLFQNMNVPYDPAAKFERVTADAFLPKYDVTSADIYAEALNNLAMVKAADLRKISAEKGMQAARGFMFPRLSFNGNVNTNYSSAAQQNTFLGRSDVETDSYVLVDNVKTPVLAPRDNFKSDKIDYNKQLSNNLYTTFSLDLTVPLFNNFTARNRVKRAGVVVKNNTYIAETTKIQLRQSIEQGYANMTAARNRYDALTKQVEAFGTSFKIAEVRFNAGVETAIDFVIAKNNLDRANNNLIIARYDYLLRTKILDYYRGKALW